MNRRVVAWLVGVGALICIVLLKISHDIKSSPGTETGALDSEQEKRFQACVAERDREIHRRVFSTIDNPDVQREYLSTQKEIAIGECRLKYPHNGAR